jgi:tripeptide aminopeptidase
MEILMDQWIKKTVLEKFLRYIAIDTRSSEESGTHPSTTGQFTLARVLSDELTALGLQNVTLDEHCYVMATLPSNVDKHLPTIGLIAHLDTSPEIPGN